MDDIRDQFQAACRDMIAAIADLTTLALRGGADEAAVSEIQGRFFDGNVELKKAARVLFLLAAVKHPEMEGPVP